MSCSAKGRKVTGEKGRWLKATWKGRFLSLSLDRFHNSAKRCPPPALPHCMVRELQRDGIWGLWQSQGPVALMWLVASLLEISVCPADIKPKSQWARKSGWSFHNTRMLSPWVASALCGSFCFLPSLLGRSFGLRSLTVLTKIQFTAILTVPLTSFFASYLLLSWCDTYMYVYARIHI